MLRLPSLLVGDPYEFEKKTLSLGVGREYIYIYVDTNCLFIYIYTNYIYILFFIYIVTWLVLNETSKHLPKWMPMPLESPNKLR